ncbi:secreted RxLR effector protein 161-like [Silene latifolia]|uniref:secreted RxLR effector protein 161-like n=1 Tax=Silene latifolia TaxID=37657 RepID=UPI003D77329E
MVVRSLDIDKDPFRPRENNEEILGPKVPYLSAIGALMYIASHTRPDISFSVNLLARFSSCPTRRHWNGIKHVLRYLQGTKDMGLFFPNMSREKSSWFCDTVYLSILIMPDHKLDMCLPVVVLAISWRSMKQTITATSSNHSEILAIHEASRECVWLRSEGYIKGDRTKHISPKFFFTHDLQKSGDINVQQIRSSENLADLFTKALPTATFKKLLHQLGLRRFKDLQ